jgi:hypothetical protein
MLHMGKPSNWGALENLQILSTAAISEIDEVDSLNIGARFVFRTDEMIKFPAAVLPGTEPLTVVLSG